MLFSSPGSSGHRVPAFSSRDGILSSGWHPRPVTPRLGQPEIVAEVRWEDGYERIKGLVTGRGSVEGDAWYVYLALDSRITVKLIPGPECWDVGWRHGRTRRLCDAVELSIG